MANKAEKVPRDPALEKDMAEAFAELKGRPAKPSRFKTTRYELPPAPSEVKALRNSLHLSQSKFAGVLNVGLRSVQAWEQGQRKPDGAATTLLWLLKKHAQVTDWLIERQQLSDPAKAESRWH